MYPILGHFYGITFYTYGTVMLASLVLIYVLAILRLDTTLLHREQLDDLGLIILISIWVGGGVVFFLFSEPRNITHLIDIFSSGKFQKAGTLSISLSVITLLSLYSWWKKLPFKRLLDFLMPFFVLGYAVQRTLGCFSAGCCYGQPSDLFWAIRFPDTLGIGPPAGIPVHPTQLYLGVTAFLTYWLMRRWETLQPRPPHGTITSVGLVGLFGSYFLVAFARGDIIATRHIGNISVNQIFSGMICVAGVVGLAWIWYSERRTKKS